jgi:hypothetical protein
MKALPPEPELLQRAQSLRTILLPYAEVRARVAAADVELRRGLMTLNGAGLVANVSLLSAKLPAHVIKASCWSFTSGLALAETAYITVEFGNALALRAHDAAGAVASALSAADRQRFEQMKREPGGAASLVLVTFGKMAFAILQGLAGCALIGSIIALAIGCWTILHALPKG